MIYPPEFMRTKSILLVLAPSNIFWVFSSTFMITDRKYLARVKPWGFNPAGEHGFHCSLDFILVYPPTMSESGCECEAINGSGVAPRRTARHQHLEALGSAHDNLRTNGKLKWPNELSAMLSARYNLQIDGELKWKLS
jgi:hypothetical protein